jgi:hypothetical protein
MAIFNFEDDNGFEADDQELVGNDVYVEEEEWSFETPSPVVPDFTLSILSYTYGKALMFCFNLFDEADGIIWHYN